MIGYFWDDFPRVRTGGKNWWYHGPSFLEPVLKGLAESDPLMNDLYQTHYGEMAWQHGMADSGESVSEIQNRMVSTTEEYLAEYQTHLKAGNHREAGFALGKALHSMQDSHTPSHMERDPKTGRILEFYSYGIQSPTLHGEEDAARRGSDSRRRATERSQEPISIFHSGDRSRIEEMYELDPEAKAGGPGLYTVPADQQISPQDLLNEIEKRKKKLEKRFDDGR